VHNPAEPGGNVGSAAGLGDLSGFREGFLGPSITRVDDTTANYDSDKAYKDSKLLNVFMTLEASRRFNAKEVTINCFNPGLVPTTGLFREYNPLFVLPFTWLTRYIFKVAVDDKLAGERLYYMITNEELIGKTGLYFSGTNRDPDALTGFLPRIPSIEAQDQQKAKEIWQLSEKLVKVI
jgi:protochlorophyllide reductase